LGEIDVVLHERGIDYGKLTPEVVRNTTTRGENDNPFDFSALHEIIVNFNDENGNRLAQYYYKVRSKGGLNSEPTTKVEKYWMVDGEKIPTTSTAGDIMHHKSGMPVTRKHILRVSEPSTIITASGTYELDPGDVLLYTPKGS
jgi:hypothetical protein